MTDGPKAGRLRWLLLLAGVGTEWSNRELERVAGYEPEGKPRVGYQTWRRMTEVIPPGGTGYDWSPKTLRMVTETLRQLGARVCIDKDGNPAPATREDPGVLVTQGMLTRAWATDFGHVGYESITVDDSLGNMIERLPFMAPEDLAKIEAAASAVRAAMERQERSDDDGGDSHRRSE